MLALVVGLPPPFAKISDPRIAESSGLARSNRRKGVYWTHNDSGDSARIFAVRLDGKVLEERRIEGATNVDWEEIAVDGDTIWINDAGNNANRRRDLALYSVPERGGKTVRYEIAYPDQKEFPPQTDRRFDCEAIFLLGGKPHLITKWRMGANFPGLGAGIYRMETRFTDRPNILKKLGERGDLGGWVTAASLSPSKRELAVLVHLPLPSIWIFDARGGGTVLSRPVARLSLGGVGAGETKQTESIVWESDASIVFGNEGGELWRVARKGFAKESKASSR